MSVVLASVTSSEEDDAVDKQDGNTTGDIQGADSGALQSTFLLRAERNGAGEGRTYKVTYQAMDGSGNQSSASSIVFVPHDQGGSAEPLTISATDDALGTLLQWDSIPTANSYRVIRGKVESLCESGDFIDLGTVVCIQHAVLAGTHVADDAEVPPLGKAFFYLASYNDGHDSGYGADTAAKPRVKTAGGCE